MKKLTEYYRFAKMEVAEIDEESFEKTMSKHLNSSTLSESETIIEVDPQYFRPTEVDLLLGDATRVKEKLGWQAEYSVAELVMDMV